MKFGLKGKTVIGLGALMLVALLVMGGATYYQGITLAVNESLESTGKNIEKDTVEIENFVNRSKDDLMVVSDTPPIHGIIRARDNAGIDPLTGDKTEYWYARLEQIFSAFLKYHPEYYQLRYIDERGDELVRVDLIGKTIRNTPRKELQNKALYPCFTETIKLKPNEVYYSEVNLNRENGVIQIPHTPVFRIATPIYDAQKRVRGVIAINVLAEAMFSNIRTAIGETKEYIVNQDGYFLVHPDRTKEYGFDLGFEYTAKNVPPESLDEMKALDSLVKYHKQEQHVDGFKKIFFDPMNKNRYWAIIHEIPEADAFKNIYISMNTMFVVGLIIVIFSLVIITWISTRKVVAPILKLSEATQKIREGDFAVRIQGFENRKDEISFNEMASSVSSELSMRKQAEDMIRKNNDMLEAISQTQSRFITGIDSRTFFDSLLGDLLTLTKSEYGFIGEIFYRDTGEPYLKTHAITNIAWNDETKAFYEREAPNGLEFTKLKSLWGTVITTGSPVISNSPSTDPKRGGLPEEHPALNAFLGLPLYSGEKLIGVAGIANRPGGYDEELVEYLKPFIIMYGNIIEAYKNIRLRNEAEEQLKRYTATLEERVKKRTSEIEKANRELKKLFNAIEQSEESIVITDINGSIQYVNPFFCKMTGYSKEEANGKNPRILKSGLLLPEVYDDLWKTILSGGTWRGTLINKKKSGDLYYENATIAPVFDEQGNITNFIAVKTDMTERIRHEEELALKNRELEEARNSAESASHTKSDFLTNMSHELRTPLNAILGFSEVLELGMAGPLTDGQKEHIRDIHESGQYLLSLINDILDLSKVEAGKMELDLSEVKAGDLINSSLIMFREKAMKHNIKIGAEIEEEIGEITADERKIKQVLFNLLSNAFKFTPDGGSVRVTARMDNDNLEISVADTGIGISEEDQKKLFQPFQQIDSGYQKKAQGTGLGLKLCKDFVELHGGRIWIESEVGKGSRFLFIIPAGGMKERQTTA